MTEHGKRRLHGALVIRSRPGGGTKISGVLAVAERPERTDGRGVGHGVADAPA